MNTSHITKACTAAAKWWADRLRKIARQESGDNSINTTKMLANALHERPTPHQVNVFEPHLAGALELALRFNRDDRHCITLSTDYDVSSEILANAAQSAGIPDTCPPFPMKTVMWVKPGQVCVRYGYGRQMETIWSMDKTTPEDRA